MTGIDFATVALIGSAAAAAVVQLTVLVRTRRRNTSPMDEPQ